MDTPTKGHLILFPSPAGRRREHGAPLLHACTRAIVSAPAPMRSVARGTRATRAGGAAEPAPARTVRLTRKRRTPHTSPAPRMAGIIILLSLASSLSTAAPAIARTADAARTATRTSATTGAAAANGSALAPAGASRPAEPDGQLSGRVLTPDGQPAAGARVTLRAVAAGTQYTAQTNDQGRYEFAGLANGAYVIEAEWRGVLRSSARSIELVNAAAPSVELALDRAAHDEQVVVTAENRAQPLEEVGKAITIIDRDALDQQAFPALGDTLMRVPGVQVLNSGGPGQLTQLRIRGVRVEGAGVLIDGLRFRDISTPQGDPTQFLANFPLIDPDRVEVLRGSASSLYGTHAVGGVVNIVSRTGQEQTGGDLQVEGGQLGLFRTRATVDGQIGGDRVRFSAGTLRLNIADGIDGHDASDATSGQGNVAIRLAPTTFVSARVLGLRDGSDLNSSPDTSVIPPANLGTGAIVRARPLPPEQLRRLAAGQPVDFGDATYIPDRDNPDARRSQRFYTAAVTATHTFGARASLRGSYQRVHTNRVFTDGPGGVGFQPLGDDFSQYFGDSDTADLRATFAPRADLSLTGGYEFERESFRQTQDNHLAGFDRVAVATRVRQEAHAGFAQASWRPEGGPTRGRLTITGSTRVQGFRLSHPAFDFNGVANVYDIPLTAPPTAVTGDASVAYTVGTRGQTKIRAHVGNAYRAPSLFERFGGGFFADPTTGIVSFTAYGDPYLEPDRYVSTDVGVDQTWWRGRATVHATYFHTRIQQMVQFDFSGAIDPSTDPYGRFGGYINGAGGRSRGLELSGSVQATSSLTVLSSYTFTDSITDKDVAVTGVFRAFGIARQTFSASAIQRVGERLDIRADLYARSSAYGALFAIDRSRAFEYPGYARVDLLVGYRLPVSRVKQVRLYGRVDNLFDARYYEIGWLTPGARFTGGVMVKY